MQLSTATKLAVGHEFLAYDNSITGSSPGSSFLTEGRHTADTLSLLLTSQPGATAWEGALDGRATDDPRVDVKRFNLKRLHLKAENERFSAAVGDFFGSFSEYTLGKSLKGAQYTQKLAGGAQVTALGGFDKPNWDDAWSHNADETVDRQVYGLRGQTPFLGDGQLGASLVMTKDTRSWANTSAVAQEQRVAGVDWSLPPFHRLWLSGESAYGLTLTDAPGLDETTFDPIYVHTTQRGWAHKVRGRWSLRRFKTVDEFERVSPEYQTTVGAASPDLIRVKTQNTMTIVGPWKWIMLSYTFFHNNLARQEGTAVSTTRMPETGLRYEAPDWRPDLSLEVKLRHREVTSTSAGLRKRTRSVIASASDRVGPVSLTLDYEYQHEDRSDGTQSLRHHLLGLGSNTFVPLPGGWKVTQGLRWDLQRDRDNLIPATDQTGAVKANALVASPWGADAGVSYARSLVLNAQTPGNDRRAWAASMGYNVLKREEHRVELRYRQNDNRFDDPGRDYKETTWELAVNNRF